MKGMTQSSPPTTDKTYPLEIRELLEKASRGDLTVLPEVRRVFDEHPDLVSHLGDLVRHAEEEYDRNLMFAVLWPIL